MSVVWRERRSVAVDHERSSLAPSDEELLCRFVTDRDELAFTRLVTNFGPLVMSVCRRVLGNQEDAEDAFQATFLVLARKASSVRRSRSLAAWLHKTAYRVALRASVKRKRRRELSLDFEPMIATETLSRIAEDHQESIVDEELNRLPDTYRLPLFLCLVEGKSRHEAALQLGWSAGSVKGRLERGRRLLRRRLMLRGVSLGVLFSLVVHGAHAARVAGPPPPDLITATAQAGLKYAAGASEIGHVSQNVLTLANESLQIMSLATKLVVCSLSIVGLLIVGGGWLSGAAGAADGNRVQQVIELKATGSSLDLPVTTVAMVAPSQQRDGEGRGRSPEAEAGTRRSPEAEAGNRRSPEAEAGNRISPEAAAGRRFSAEGMGRRDGMPRPVEFQPQSPREAVLYKMILDLQRQVAELRRELLARDSRRDGAPDAEGSSRSGSRDRDPARSSSSQNSKIAKIYRAYDKNQDGRVSVMEFLAMREGMNDPRVRAQAEESFKQADRNRDSHLSFEEFVGASQRRTEGGRPSPEGDRPRDGDSPRREGDRPRDGDSPRREGDRPRDGDSPRREGDQPRDGDSPRRDAE